jgi:hypothetical protein
MLIQEHKDFIHITYDTSHPNALHVIHRHPVYMMANMPLKMAFESSTMECSARSPSKTSVIKKAAERLESARPRETRFVRTEFAAAEKAVTGGFQDVGVNANRNRSGSLRLTYRQVV